MTNERKIIEKEVDMLRLAEKRGNISERCKVLGYSRESLYRLKELYENGGEETLKEISKKKRKLKNHCEPAFEHAVLKMAFKLPAYGQEHVSNELKKQGILLSLGAFGVFGYDSISRFSGNASKLSSQKLHRMVVYSQNSRSLHWKKQSLRRRLMVQLMRHILGI